MADTIMGFTRDLIITPVDNCAVPYLTKNKKYPVIGFQGAQYSYINIYYLIIDDRGILTKILSHDATVEIDEGYEQCALAPEITWDDKMGKRPGSIKKSCDKCEHNGTDDRVCDVCDDYYSLWSPKKSCKTCSVKGKTCLTLFNTCNVCSDWRP